MRSGLSTSKVLHHFGEQKGATFTGKHYPEFRIQYDIFDDQSTDIFALKSNLDNLREKKPSCTLQVFTDQTKVSLSQLKQEFEKLSCITSDSTIWQTYKEQEQISLEQYKLILIKSVQNQLTTGYQHPIPKQENSIKKTSNWLWLLFGTFMLLEIIPMLWGGFLGIQSLMMSLPGVSPFLADTFAITACSIESLLFYAVMSPLLKEGLGISLVKFAKPRLEIYNQQLDAMQQIDIMMTVENEMPAYQYARYIALLKLFNKDLSQLQIQPFKETPIKKVLRYSLNGLNLILNVGGGYFFAGALLAAVPTTAALIGTPIGWGIVAFIILGQLALRFVVRSNAMLDLLNPTAARHEKIRERIVQFKSNDKKYEETLSDKQNISYLRKQKMQNAARRNPYVDSYRGHYCSNQARVSTTQSLIRAENTFNTSIKFRSSAMPL